MLGSINSFESLGLVDGPGIRCVVFLNGCKLRCKYCHNPETWHISKKDTAVNDLIKKIIRYKPYFKNNGGVTFSGGEPLLQPDFLIEICRELKKENIHIALDTAGVGIGKYDEILENVDLVLLDIKHTSKEGFKTLTGGSIDDVEEFIEHLNKSNKKVWIRQVIVPGMMDNDEYISSLIKYLKKIKNIENITFLPFHTLGKEKYEKLHIDYPLKDINDMDKEECEKLYKKFLDQLKKDL